MADDTENTNTPVFSSVRKNEQTTTPADQRSMQAAMGSKDNADSSYQTDARQAVLTFGDTGLRRSGGFINDDIDACMDSVYKRTQTFKKMSTDSTVFGALLAYTSMFRDANVDVKPASDKQVDKTYAEDVQHAMMHMRTDFRDIMSEVATMFTYGYAALEVTYARKTGNKFKNRILPEFANLRSQDTIHTWFFTDEGVPIGFEQQPFTTSQTGTGTRFVPLDKCIFVRTTASRENPTGASVLRGAVTDWFYKHRLQEIEGIGIERDLAGLPVMRVPSLIMNSQDPASRAAFSAYQSLVKDIRRDEKEGLVLPSDRDERGHLYYELELLNSNGSRNFNTTEIIKRYDVGIAISMLADFILLGHNRVGSFSLSSTKTELFAVALSSFLGVTEQQMQKRFVDDVWRYNGLPEKNKPQIKFAPIELPDLEVLGNYIRNLSRAGAELFPDVDLENDLRNRAGLPHAPADRKTIDPTPTADQAAGQRSRSDAAPEGEGAPQRTSTESDKSGDAIAASLANILSRIDDMEKRVVAKSNGHTKLSEDEVSAMKAKARRDNAEAERVELENNAYKGDS